MAAFPLWARAPKNSLDGPVEGNERDYRGGGQYNPTPIPRAVTEPAHGEEGTDNDRKLAALDAKVKTNQAKEKILPRQADIGKGAGKAQPVNQSKTPKPQNPIDVNSLNEND